MSSFRETPSGEVIPTALPDPKNKKWHDSLYYCGDSAFRKVPVLKDVVEAVSPPTISDAEGGVEKTCTLIIMVNICILLSYVYFGLTGYKNCTQVRFLSLEQTPNYCDEVKNAINDRYAVDNDGYWETFYDWSFAESMVGAKFVDFKTTETEWQTYAKNLWLVYDNWNSKWEKQASVDNLMAMVVSEQKVTGSGLLLAEVLADPISLMASNFKDCIAVNNLLADGSFVLTYSDLDSSFYLSAAQSYWTQRLPKWKFASNTLDDDALQQDDQEDPLQGVMINKYSLWVAAAVNMGIIDLSHLTKLTETSFTDTYKTVADDDDSATDDLSNAGEASSDGAVCAQAIYYKDGYCDSANNKEACLWDGGDCCESTCGVGYETDTDCGTAGYNCLNPSASDYGDSETVVYDDDEFFDDGFSGYTYGTFYDDDFAFTYSDDLTCENFFVQMHDSACDGWEGNYLKIGSTKLIMEGDCSSNQTICLKSGTYKPYACGGNYPSEISWTITSEDGNWTDSGGGSVLCDWEYCGSVTIVVDIARRLTEAGEEAPSQHLRSGSSNDAREQFRDIKASRKRDSKQQEPGAPTQPRRHSRRLNAGAPTALPSQAPSPLPSVAPSSEPTLAPTHTPTVDYYYEFGLTDYLLYKYYEEMQPIQCAHVNGSQYCWVKGNAGERGTEDENLGAYLFPIMQHFNKDCYNCSSKAANNPDECNDVDLEILLFFNPKAVSKPHFVHTYNATEREERRKYDIDNSGLDGLIYMNLYGGVKFLNDLFYELPDTHCTKPIAIAKGPKTKNAQACGTKYQKSLVASKHRGTSKVAKKSYCVNTPSAPQERYFECRYSPQECVSTAIAEASGQTSLVSGVLLFIMVYLAINLLGVPKSVKSQPPGAPELAEAGFFGSMADKARKCFGDAKDAKADMDAKKKSQDMDGDIELYESNIGQKDVNMDKLTQQPTLASLQAEARALNEKIEKLARSSDPNFLAPKKTLQPTSTGNTTL